MRPNFIQGMKTRGHLRSNKDKHFSKLARAYLKEKARIAKEEAEKERRARSNREYEY